MKVRLLDTNVLVALLWPSHAQHAVAVKWFSRHRGRGWATCPITEAGFIRVVSNPAFSRDAVTPGEAGGLLAANTAAADHVFWTDDVPFADATTYSGTRLVGHQQVTDAYLLGLAIRRQGALATLDAGIVALLPTSSPDRRALEVIT